MPTTNTAPQRCFIGAAAAAPLIWALKSSVTSSPDALSRCKRVVDRSWICPRLSPLAPMRSTAPHHLISGRDRVPDQHPACNGNGLRGGRDQSFNLTVSEIRKLWLTV